MHPQQKFKIYSIGLIHIGLYGLSIFHSLSEDEISLKYFFFIFLVLVNFLSMTNLSLLNPGFICKNFKNRNREEIIKFQHNSEIRKFFKKDKWHMSIKIGEEEYFYKYCEECNIFKIQGVSHCRECDCCVFRMDHHCYWFGTCIARNNIKYFYLYLYSAMILFYFGHSSLMHISDLVYDEESILKRTLYCILALFDLLIALLFSLLVIFTIYYLYLALTDISSRKFIKNIKRYQKIDLKSVFKRLLTEPRKISCEKVHH